MIREVMGNFAQLVPHGQDGIFKVNSLIGATEALTRSMLEGNGGFVHEGIAGRHRFAD